jgi:hypothetical protein
MQKTIRIKYGEMLTGECPASECHENTLKTPESYRPKKGIDRIFPTDLAQVGSASLQARYLVHPGNTI